MIVAFLPSIPLSHSHFLSPSLQITRPTTRPISPPKLRTQIHANFKQDFFTGPSTPPRPRPLYQVILFTVTTNLLWYGYYKYCIEEELRNQLKEGPGGIGALLPFTVGVTSPLYLPTGGPAEIGVALGVAWIVSLQYYLYKRINRLVVEAGRVPPLTPWWVIVPGFNLVVGLRSVHFLSVLWGGNTDDPIANRFPCLGKDTLGMKELITSPNLWLKL